MTKYDSCKEKTE